VEQINNFQPKVVWDNNFFLNKLTREVFIEKIFLHIKYAVLNEWKRENGILSFSIKTKCDFCKKESTAIFDYGSKKSNKTLGVCIYCDELIICWSKYFNGRIN